VLTGSEGRPRIHADDVTGIRLRDRLPGREDKKSGRHTDRTEKTAPVEAPILVIHFADLKGRGGGVREYLLQVLEVEGYLTSDLLEVLLKREIAPQSTVLELF
jgi:hypothetical protein